MSKYHALYRHTIGLIKIHLTRSQYESSERHEVYRLNGTNSNGTNSNVTDSQTHTVWRSRTQFSKCHELKYEGLSDTPVDSSAPVSWILSNSWMGEYIHTRIPLYTFIRKHIHICICVYVYWQTHMYGCIHVLTHIHMWDIPEDTHEWVNVYIYVYPYIHLYAHKYKLICM